MMTALGRQDSLKIHIFTKNKAEQHECDDGTPKTQNSVDGRFLLPPFVLGRDSDDKQTWPFLCAHLFKLRALLDGKGSCGPGDGGAASHVENTEMHSNQ
jgi:hypothetical protein